MTTRLSRSAAYGGLEHRREEPEAAGIPERRIGGAVGVGHQAHDRPARGADPRDVVDGAVRVLTTAGGGAVLADVAADDEVLPLDPLHRLLVGGEAAVAVRHRH